MSNYTGLEIAVIGIACRFPEAKNWREYWNNLVNERECIRHYTKQELLDMGCSPDLIEKENYVKAEGVLPDKHLFDAPFFSYTPNEVSFMNPVHRLFHECVWEAIEDAGISPENTNQLTGVFGCAHTNLAWPVHAMLRNRENLIDKLSLDALAGKESLASLVSYKLDLKGTAQFIDTTCSSSLVAVNTACKNLLLGDIDIALAGSVTIENKDQPGYIHDEYFILSSDGHCRSFDKNADGTVGSEGVAVIVLKRLQAAIKAGDNIYCIIKGSATNNDGKRKIGYAAPSVQGMADCITRALQFSAMGPERIGYVETHGTATKLGDLIEVSALQIAYKNVPANSCAIGSVKTNIGHTWATSGLAALIKVALGLKNQTIPASLNYHQPNPEINFNNSPFYVNTKTRHWERKDDSPLCAGLNAFGVGGTNAHVILEEYIDDKNNKNQNESTYKILPLSAKTGSALIRYANRLHEFITNEPALDLEKLAYTLQTGRTAFLYREAFIFKTREELLHKLANIQLNEEGIVKSNTLNAGENFNITAPVDDNEHNWFQFLNKLLTHWKYGATVDWHRLYHDSVISKISLPTYAFDQVSFPTTVNYSELFDKPVVPKAEHNGVKQFPIITDIDETIPGIENKLTAIFTDFFGIKEIMREDDFFDLGGDSLKAVMLTKDIGRIFDIQVSPAFLYDFPTIKELAQEINQICLAKIFVTSGN